jgi:hypothetical protein
MSFRTAVWITLGLLLLPLAGILFTVLSSDKPRRHNPARAEKTAQLQKKPTRVTREEPPKDKEPEPLIHERGPKNAVTLSADFAKSETGLSGHLLWLSDGIGSKISNPCPKTGCLGDEGAALCAKGKAARLGKNPPAAKRWGAAIGWNLNEEAGQVRRLGKSKVAGLSFVLKTSGRDPKRTAPNAEAPPLLKATEVKKTSAKAEAEPRRKKAASEKTEAPSEPVTEPSGTYDYVFALTVGDTDYCTAIRPGKNRILFKDLRKNCLEKKNRPKIVPGIIPEAKMVKWKVPSPSSQDEHFDICISDLRTLEH